MAGESKKGLESVSESLKDLTFFIYLYFIFGCTRASLLRAFSSCSEWVLLFAAVHGHLTAVAPLVAEHRLGARAS